MNILILIFLFILQAQLVSANTQDKIEAKDCSLKECLQLQSQTNANNETRQASRFMDKKMAKMLSTLKKVDSRAQDTEK